MMFAQEYIWRTGTGAPPPMPALTITQPKEGFAMADVTQSPNSSVRKPLTVERLREVLHYDPETGIFTWRKSLAPRGPVGAVAGCVSRRRKDYIVIRIDGRLYLAHRLAWFYITGEWPAAQIDHDDTNPSNNRWKNLREATNAENTCNQGKRSTNTSGFKGVTWFKRDGVWAAQIMLAGKHYHLGYFKTPEAAHAAYVTASARLHGSFGRTE